MFFGEDTTKLTPDKKNILLHHGELLTHSLREKGKRKVNIFEVGKPPEEQ